MDSNFEERKISNVFQVLDDRQSLLLIGLSLGANDLTSNLDCMIEYQENNSRYFFTNSISILRELAKVIVAIKKSGLCAFHSKRTSLIYDQLYADLSSFDENSFSKKVLKPVRDISFHYNLQDECDADKKEALESALSVLKKESSIAIRISLNDHSLLGQRYTFADSFRSNAIYQFLSNEKAQQLSAIAQNIHSYVDSLIDDLLQKNRVSQV